MSTPALRERLRRNELIVAAMITEFANPAIVTMMTAAGADSVFLDLEHSTFDWPSIATIIALGDRCGLHVAVRVPEIRREPIQKVLDAGAHALVVPMVNTPEEARDVVRLAKYHPDGERGVALRRAHSNFVAPPDPADYMRTANSSVAIMAQIETKRGVSAAAQIAEVDGIDVLFVGPSDLSASNGSPGATWSNESRESYATVLASAQRHGKSAAIHVTDLAQAIELAVSGFRYLSVATDVSAIIDTIAASTHTVRTAVARELTPQQ
jgi:2-keto-3-deoxy-L-rhamnonate aldolase RhmA